MTQYSADESDGTVAVVVEVLDGDIQGASVTVMLSTADGTAICEFLFYASRHHTYVHVIKLHFKSEPPSLFNSTR